MANEPALKQDSQGGPPPFRSDADIAFITSRLINQGGVADGPSIPRPVRGEFRVPMVSGLRVVGTPTASFGGTIFTLAWNSPADQFVSRYNVYAKFLLDQNAQPTLVGSSATSPLTVRVTADSAGTVVFFVQTILANGQSLPVGRCPTCTGTTLAPTIGPDSIANHSISNDKLAQGPETGALISFEDTGGGPDALYISPPSLAGFVLTSSAPGNVPFWNFPSAFRLDAFAFAADISALNDTPLLILPNTLPTTFMFLSAGQKYTAGTTPFTNYGGESRLAATYGINGANILAVPITSDKFASLTSYEAFFGVPGTLQGPASDFASKDIYLQWDPSATGRVITASVSAGGTGYAPGDTGTSGDTDPWTYTVDTIGGGGDILTFTVNLQGTEIAKGASATTATSGAGTGFIANIDTIQTLDAGDGFYFLTALYTFFDL